MKSITIFLKRKQKKSDNMGVNDMKISLKIINKSKLSIVINIIKYERIKMLHKYWLIFPNIKK